MSDAPVSIHTQDGVRTLTIQRPEKLNALNGATLQALDSAFAEAATDESVRVVVLTGAGSKAFVAGADIAEMNTLTPVQGRDFSLLGQQLMRRIERMPKPVIAMVNGFALGGGLELAMVLATEPSVLLLDEPTAGLTKPERMVIGKVLSRLTRDFGLCIVLIEHDLDFVREISDRVVVLHQGALLMEGTVDEVVSSELVRSVYAGHHVEAAQ